VAVTVVVPTANVCGEVIVVAPILYVIAGHDPVAVALNDTLAMHCPDAAFTVWFAGHVMVGALITTNVAVSFAKSAAVCERVTTN